LMKLHAFWVHFVCGAVCQASLSRLNNFSDF
jgi:hypothetical protein